MFSFKVKHFETYVVQEVIFLTQHKFLGANPASSGKLLLILHSVITPLLHLGENDGEVKREQLLLTYFYDLDKS